jgi:hypothetical protein
MEGNFKNGDSVTQYWVIVMPDPQGTLVDGNRAWSGGMDTSRQPVELSPDQYARACNVRIPRTGGGIQNRGGFVCQFLDFQGNKRAKEIYETGHIQGEGWYFDGKESALLRSVNGFIFEFRKKINESWIVKILNFGDQNDPDRTKAWFIRIPQGAVMNDGLSNPFVINGGVAKRTNPDIGEIGPGRMGLYVQNRLFYVTTDRKQIIASDFRNPTSLLNAVSTNVLGFYVPNDAENITAIGEQKAMLDYTEGGVLIFSTENHIYSIDVRGDRQAWEIADSDSKAGLVRESIPGIGATSSYSFENFNTNVYFRAAHFGLTDIRQSQYQFVTEEDFEEQSVEASYWMDNDTEWMLDQCYTRRFKNRLFTTISPETRSDGFVFWNGMISVRPNPRHANKERFPRRFESLITGVRPWCITAINDPRERASMYIDSFDTDGINRLYRYEPLIDYDVNHQGERIDIEAWLETRGYGFKFEEEPKRMFERYYSLRGLTRDLQIKVFYRSENDGEWQGIKTITHRVKTTCRADQLVPAPYRPQFRKKVNLPDEPESDCNLPSGIGGSTFYSRQYRFELKGPFVLDRFVLKSMPTDDNKDPIEQSQEDVIDFASTFDLPRDFSYGISDRLKVHA